MFCLILHTNYGLCPLGIPSARDGQWCPVVCHGQWCLLLPAAHCHPVVNVPSAHDWCPAGMPGDSHCCPMLSAQWYQLPSEMPGGACCPVVHDAQCCLGVLGADAHCPLLLGGTWCQVVLGVQQECPVPSGACLMMVPCVPCVVYSKYI